MIFVFVINLSELIGFRVFCVSKTFRIVFFSALVNEWCSFFGHKKTRLMPGCQTTKSMLRMIAMNPRGNGLHCFRLLPELQ